MARAYILRNMGGAASVGSARPVAIPLTLALLPPTWSLVFDAPSGVLLLSKDTIGPAPRYACAEPPAAPMPPASKLERRPSAGGTTMAVSAKSVALAPLGERPANAEPPIDIEPDLRMAGCASNDVEIDAERCSANADATPVEPGRRMCMGGSAVPDPLTPSPLSWLTAECGVTGVCGVCGVCGESLASAPSRNRGGSARKAAVAIVSPCPGPIPALCEARW